MSSSANPTAASDPSLFAASPTTAELEARYPIVSIAEGLSTMWDNGWHPFDVVRVVDPSFKAAQAAIVDALALQRQDWHPQAGAVWTTQADALGATNVWWKTGTPYWKQFVTRHELQPNEIAWQINFLMRVLVDPPTQPRFEASPTQPGWLHGSEAANDTVLSKVRALLAKAESTDFDHEAEALSAKAQELITRHSIDVALLADTVDVPGGRRVYIDAPYAKAKYLLLSNIAEANGCRCVWNNQRATATLVGHQTDLHLSEVLFTSLLVQATSAIIAAGSHRDSLGSSRTRAWRNAFWQGYAYRIGQRLADARADARKAYGDSSGDLAPVLARRDAAVEAAVSEAFPRLGTLRTSISSGDGLVAGQEFGDRAHLDASRTMPTKSARPLTA